MGGVEEEKTETMNNELYINFDEYIRQGEPQKRERAEAWRVAIYNEIKAREKQK